MVSFPKISIPLLVDLSLAKTAPFEHLHSVTGFEGIKTEVKLILSWSETHYGGIKGCSYFS